MENVNEVREAAERRLHEGDAAFLADLGIALVQRCGAGAEHWQYRSVLDRLLRLLTITAGAENVAQALRLISAARAVQHGLDRFAALLLASSQAPTDLAAAFVGDESSGGASDELRACLVHELVLRDVVPFEVPGVAEWVASPDWRRHSLARLPLELSAIEENRDLPDYGIRGHGSSMPFGPSTDHTVVAWAGGTRSSALTATETTTNALEVSITAAVANWTEESNGQAEARVFEFAGPVDADAVPATLLSVGLESLNDRRHGATFSTYDYGPAVAWRMLFAAACNGGAYSPGYFGAYGRLAAWQSLAGLCGAAEDAGIADIAALAQECSWYGFDTDSEWFNQVAWDIGIATLDPRRLRLAVLAATDTD